jgi:transcription elongation factor Elf1
MDEEVVITDPGKASSQQWFDEKRPHVQGLAIKGTCPSCNERQVIMDENGYIKRYVEQNEWTTVTATCNSCGNEWEYNARVVVRLSLEVTGKR